jgi:MSHA pilin protein MshC
MFKIPVISYVVTKGFSLVELIVVLLLVGVLATFAVPRMNLAGFRSAGFTQQATTAIRFAQKQAISSGCSVTVEIDTVDADICELKWNGCAGNSNLTNPASGNTDFCADSTPEGSVPLVNFTFDRIGAPTAAQSITIDSRTITVEANTGFTHE